MLESVNTLKVSEVLLGTPPTDPTCERHGGTWGTDPTCHRCTHKDGTPRLVGEPGYYSLDEFTHPGTPVSTPTS